MKVRTAPIAAALIAVLALAGCLTPEQQTAHDAMNNSRRANGRAALSMHGSAQSKAQAWAEKMARDGRISHSNPISSGISGCWRNLGENVGYGGSIAAVQNAFMNSPSHRANVLDTKWNGVGIGVAKRGNQVYVAQVFIRAC